MTLMIRLMMTFKTWDFPEGTLMGTSKGLQEGVGGVDGGDTKGDL